MGLTPPALIDPALRLDRNEKSRIVQAAWKRWLAAPAHRVLALGGLAVVILVYLLAPGLIEPLLGSHRWYHTPIRFAVYLGGLATLAYLFRRYQFAPCVYAELRARGHDVCSRCGYLLANLSPGTARCPECGAERG